MKLKHRDILKSKDDRKMIETLQFCQIGKTKVAVVPLPSSLTSDMLPLWSSTMDFTNASPRPTPLLTWFVRTVSTR